MTANDPSVVRAGPRSTSNFVTIRTSAHYSLSALRVCAEVVIGDDYTGGEVRFDAEIFCIEVRLSKFILN